MKKGKLNLDKKSIAKLSEENLENVQGGEAQFLSLWKCNCTNITVIETEAPAEAQSLAPATDIVLSCKV
jgi:hypothetical protein